MHIKNFENVEPFDDGTGELAYELSGLVAGPKNTQHSVAYIKILPGKSSKNHFHPVAEESYYIIKGEGRMVIEDEQKILKPHDLVVIPPTKKHQIFNDKEENLEFIAICVPPWTPDCSEFI